jgi:hypothetical protein
MMRHIQQDLLDVLQEHLKSGRVQIMSSAEEESYITTFLHDYPKYFPSTGASLLWSASETDQSPDWEAAFLDEIGRLSNLDEDELVAVLWDDASYVSLVIPFSLLRNLLVHFLLPPHMYFFPLDLRWAASFRMEGYLGFGVNPSQIHEQPGVDSPWVS